LLVILGDRFDMFPGALAALPFRIPIVHIHGGEVTVGAIDDALRHAITKLSHLHFATTEAHGRRVVQMGEEPWRVTVCGAPALDGLEDQPRLTPAEIERRFSIALTPTPLLVTFHPVTLEYEDTARQVAELLGALEDSKLPVVFTAPNADTAGRVVRAEVEKFVASRQNAWLVENFGQQAYFSMFRHAAAMVGNSSSGIIEAGSFGLPVVNIGNRQSGRVRGANVIDVDGKRAAILAAIQRAVSPEFREKLRDAKNPYRIAGTNAADLILNRLKTVSVDDRLLCKRFHDLHDQ
jgi:UDP-hydrolysing UDP-N-acetyl-D-glucosamine 2-epimerase